MSDLEIRRRLRSALVGTAYHDDRVKIANLLAPFVENIVRDRLAAHDCGPRTLADLS